MTYKEQLLSETWESKRKTILGRDNNKCTECSNKSFEKKFKRGIILGKKEDLKQTPFKIENKYLCKIWTFDEPIILNTFISDKNYSDQKSYISYYYQSDSKPNFGNIVALQEMQAENIELDVNFFEKILKKDPNPKFTDETKKKVFSPIDINSSWSVIFNLHVHHTYYQAGLNAWEYPDASLITLCWECHEYLHKETVVPKLDKFGYEIGKIKTCLRCHGAGIFPEYSQVYFGICFRCDGFRYERN